MNSEEQRVKDFNEIHYLKSSSSMVRRNLLSYISLKFIVQGQNSCSDCPAISKIFLYHFLKKKNNFQYKNDFFFQDFRVFVACFFSFLTLFWIYYQHNLFFYYTNLLIKTNLNFKQLQHLNKCIQKDKTKSWQDKLPYSSEV